MTVIIIFSVEPERQQELVDTTVDFLCTVNAQWRSLEIYQAFVNNSDMQAKGAKLSEFDKPDSHVYEVVISESKFGRL
ncbi:MAG: hypothetical protein BRC34_12850 [Cyanobacteria bacterium QH_1_48_107]|nr:MAG: hypothetical protein BRC34_12850 [Cyanobacteria bacterium QH_1_48_107]